MIHEGGDEIVKHLVREHGWTQKRALEYFRGLDRRWVVYLVREAVAERRALAEKQDPQ